MDESHAPDAAAGLPGEGGPVQKIILTVEPGRNDARLMHSPLVDGDKVFWLGRNVPRGGWAPRSPSTRRRKSVSCNTD